MSTDNTKTFPSIRADMGAWTYFITTLTFADVAAFIKRPKQTSEDEELKDWLQREIDPDRLKNIANYLIEHEQHFFNAIVVGIYGGEPQWYPVSVSGSPTLRDVNISERTRTSMGILCLTGDEEAFPIDGQHRVEGIKIALEHDINLANEEQCIIFVAHHTDKAGHERVRRLFATLNRYARPVSKGEIIALDQDDAFAIVTRKLTEEFAPLRRNRFATFTKTTNVPPNDKKGITTILALYDLVKTIAAPKTIAGNVERNKLIIGPPKAERINEIYKQQIAFWDSIKKHVPEIRSVINSRKTAGDYRKDTGGHLLFRPVGQMAFANAVRIMMDRKVSMDDAVATLSKLPLELEKRPWRHVLWNPDQEKVINSNNTLAQNLFLYMLGQEPLPKKYDVEEKYKKALGDNEGSLKGLVKANVTK
jgi:DNA sulfur modification protein DndB